MTHALRLPLRTDPVVQPLAMPDQDLHTPFHDPLSGLPAAQPETLVFRMIALITPLATIGAVGGISLGWFALDGTVTLHEAALVTVTAFAFYWVVLSVVTALLGLFWRPRARPEITADQSLRIAILLPMYGEPPQQTVGNAVALLSRLAAAPHHHNFSLHILSDTRSSDGEAMERAVCQAWRRTCPQLPIFYRRRTLNTDFKSGNIRDWVQTRGHLYDAMLVLDADSIMGHRSVILLADTLAGDPACGLIQTIPRVLPGSTIWQRMQSFSSEVYGVNLARGFALWTGAEGNFVGHNAIIRTRAFAAAAGLPHLPGPAPRGGVILSHDFVEAALLRRAGWAVRMLPEASDSFEDTPESLLGYVRRDRRWCQGNMQHLRLLRVPGLHPLSQFHFLQGAMAYLASLWWLVLLMLWALPGETGIGTAVWSANPLAPLWRSLPAVTQITITALIGLMLIGPKIIGIASYLRNHPLSRHAARHFAGMVLLELLLSMMIAPTLMIHHVRAVLSTLTGVDGGWMPHATARPPLAVLLRFHATETLLGLGLLTLAAMGQLTLWLLPVALCLTCATPLSLLVQTPVTWGHIPETAKVKP